MVRGLDKDSFTCLLINWYRRAKGKYKVPTFAHQELDLHKVFWEVQDKGGYDQVTNFKLWKVTPHLPPPLPSTPQALPKAPLPPPSQQPLKERKKNFTVRRHNGSL